MFPLPMAEPRRFAFFLGTHRPCWLARTSVPLFVSRRTLSAYKVPPKALGRWALDSGAFTELSLYGEFRTPATQYASEVRHWHDTVGGLQWAAAQDWPCEPFLTQKTGFSVAEHQRRTVANYLLLRGLALDLPWVPVLQGFTYAEYLHCWRLYEAEGIDLLALPLVGLGSVCRRQDTSMVEGLIRMLSGLGMRIHAFGFKLLGVRRAGRFLASSDSMAWSLEARKRPPLPGHTHKSCANCIEYALQWREKVLRAVAGSEASEQGILEFDASLVEGEGDDRQGDQEAAADGAADAMPAG